MSKAPTRLEKVYTDVSVQVLTVILILVVLELAVRAFTDHISPIDINAQTLVTDKSQEPFFQAHPFAAFRWIPYARFARQTVNGDGFVSTRDIPLEKRRDEVRIITLGGSSTVGNGNIDEETYPRLLETLLQRRYPQKDVTVINAAAGGYSTIESLGYLQTRLVHYQPDYLILMHAWNDMYYFVRDPRGLSEWRENFNLQAMWNPEVALEMEDPMPGDVQYLSWSQFYLHLRELVRRSGFFEDDEEKVMERRYHNLKKAADGSSQIMLQPIREEALALYGQNLRQIQGFCRVRKIRCFSILQPTLVSRNVNRSSARIQKAMQISALYHGFDFDTHIKVFERLYKINIDVFGKNGVIDARPMNGREELFFDHIHQNAAGTKVLAEMVRERLARELDGAS